MNKTKKMTQKYWKSLRPDEQKRALKFVFPLNDSAVEMLLDDNKPNPKNDPWWKLVFLKVRIPHDGSPYKTVVNNTYIP